MPGLKKTVLALCALAFSALSLPALAQETITGQAQLLEAPLGSGSEPQTYSGEVKWSAETTEGGEASVVAVVTVPERNIGLRMTFTKNTAADLAATHLAQLVFETPFGFNGGTVEGVPGILLKTEQTGRGTPLAGASSRIIPNEFLFALSSEGQAPTTNAEMLRNQSWMDVLLIYATSRQAIITL